MRNSNDPDISLRLLYILLLLLPIVVLFMLPGGAMVHAM